MAALSVLTFGHRADGTRQGRRLRTTIRRMSFFQEPPRLENEFAADRLLRGWLRREIPSAPLSAMDPSLDRMGRLAAGPLHELAMQYREDEPKHVPWDAWGRRADRIEVNAAWQEYQRVAAREGLVATGYE